ncbi:LCP family glycopolymer transferase, partial [Staphylococcus epidermidis]|uniref:LCP family glycopolymer transferase n=1 Tax=Staphylococcus epidermidis TaxID=1282 RepID=UPI0037D992F9
MKNHPNISLLLLPPHNPQAGKSPTHSIIILQYHYLHKKIKIISLITHIYPHIPPYHKYKINPPYSLPDPQFLTKTLNKNLPLNPHYYPLLHFTPFQKIIHQLHPNPLPIHLQKHISQNIPLSFKKPHHNLNPKQLLPYPTFPHHPQPHFPPLTTQQQLIQTLNQHLLNFNTLPKLPKLPPILTHY